MGPFEAFVAVGSNIDPIRHVPRGLARLHAVAPVTACSRFFRTPAIGADGLTRKGDPDFANGMVRVRTRLAPLQLRRVLHRIEADSGRVRTEDRYAPRQLDLDLVVHAGRILDGDLPLRRHLAVCLLELAPGFELVPGTPLRDPGGMAMTPMQIPLPDFGRRPRHADAGPGPQPPGRHADLRAGATI